MAPPSYLILQNSNSKFGRCLVFVFSSLLLVCAHDDRLRRRRCIHGMHFPYLFLLLPGCWCRELSGADALTSADSQSGVLHRVARHESYSLLLHDSKIGTPPNVCGGITSAFRQCRMSKPQKLELVNIANNLKM